MADRDFLVFRLNGPMAAFGDIAVGERRSLWDVPSKSGVLGLLAACLGLDRNDDAAHTALHDDLGFAVRVDNAGNILRDFHTAQTPTEASREKRRRAGLPLSTARDQLSCGSLYTVVSNRLYRAEVAVTVALWVRPQRQRDLDALSQALRQPHFVPYLGRKSCPLGAPPCPTVVAAPGLLAAFNAFDQSVHAADQSLPVFARRKADDSQRPVWFERNAGLEAEDASNPETRQRRDGLRQRSRWQFSDRLEGVLWWTPPAPADKSEVAA